MTTTQGRIRRTAAGTLSAGLLLLSTAACSETATSEDAGVSASVSADAGDVSDAASDAASDVAENAEVDCSGTSCDLTLAAGQEADVLGTTVAFDSTEDGVATLRVGDREAQCEQGEEVSAGPLTVQCSTVGEDSVTLSASLG